MEEIKNQEQLVTFAAIDPVIERLIESPSEKRWGGSDMMRWGDKNTYPQYILGLTRECPTLRTVVLGYIDYICGNGMTANVQLAGLPAGIADRRGTTFEQLARKEAGNASKFGALAFKVTRNVGLDTIAEIECIPLQYLRSDEDNEVFWYSEKWEKGGLKRIEYPRYIPGAKVAESIYFVKLWGDGVYPEPVFAAAVKECECERGIADFHLGNLFRGFMGSYLVNFNNGVIPTDKIKEETERAFTEKFAGHSNAGRIMFSWNRNKDAQTTFQKMEVSDYGEKYKTLSEHCERKIFVAFRAHPTLFGISESSGFNQEEYDGAFRLFNRTMVVPVQKQIIDAFEYLTGAKGAFAIEPFDINLGAEKEVQ